MYTTCLFCNGDLGRNEVIEAFPVGRRLAFDAAKGRLWVVCRRCERWNLTPLEERWEAIEECERAFRATKLRVSTDEIGLARVKEGLELVRIGAPQRPEMAAWRYGDQFGRRRRRYYAMVAGGVAVAGVAVVAGPILGLVSVGAINPAVNLLRAGRAIYRSRTIVHAPTPDGGSLRARLSDLDRVRLTADERGPVLRVPVVLDRESYWKLPVLSGYRYARKAEPQELHGEAAVRAAGALLPHMNQSGGSAADVQRAVGYLEDAPTPEELFRHAAGAIAKRGTKGFGRARGNDLLKNLPTANRLALEMAAHEDVERRALEGELHVLEAAWRQAEEIAGIADDMFVSESVDRELARLKRERDERSTD